VLVEQQGALDLVEGKETNSVFSTITSTGGGGGGGKGSLTPSAGGQVVEAVVKVMVKDGVGTGTANQGFAGGNSAVGTVWAVAVEALVGCTVYQQAILQSTGGPGGNGVSSFYYWFICYLCWWWWRWSRTRVAGTFGAGGSGGGGDGTGSGQINQYRRNG
jgi:hypothetical protein